MAEYYSTELAEKVIRGQTENATKCKFNGGSVTFGYYIDDDQHFQIDEETALYITQIYKAYDSGMTMKKIAEDLNNKGVSNVRGADSLLISFQKFFQTEDISESMHQFTNHTYTNVISFIFNNCCVFCSTKDLIVIIIDFLNSDSEFFTTL